MAKRNRLDLDDRIARSDIWFYPGETLHPDQMRVTLMGTGWGNIIRPNQKGASVYIELGSGEAFLFDAGPGCSVNYNVMQVPFSRMDKVFLTHLHTDHTSDVDWIYTFGPSVDRYTPFHLFGPHNFGDRPVSGGVAIPSMTEFVSGLVQATHWHRVSFAATLDVAKAYDVVVHPLDYRAVPPRTGARGTPPARGKSTSPALPGPVPDGVTVAMPERKGIAYYDRKHGVTIKHWPALHIIDGAISYCLEWNGYKVVWSGDTRPNHYMMELAGGADLLIHETAPTVDRLVAAQQDLRTVAQRIIDFSHTPARALGKILSVTDPTVAVTCHAPIDPEEWTPYVEDVRAWWMNPKGIYQIGEDLMVFTLSPGSGKGVGRGGKRNEVSIRKGYVHERPWGVRVAEAPNPDPPYKSYAKRYQTEIFDNVLSDLSWKMPNVEGLEHRLEAARRAARRKTQQASGGKPAKGKKGNKGKKKR